MYRDVDVIKGASGSIGLGDMFSKILKDVLVEVIAPRGLP